MAQNKHISYNAIPDFSTDWQDDPTNDHKPFSGKSVQDFIKQELQKGYGYSRTANGYLQNFRSADDADAYDQGDTSKLLNQVSLSGSNVEFRFVDQFVGNVYINGNNDYLFPVTVKSVDVNADKTETPHDSNISLSIMVNLNNGTTTTELGTFPANERFFVNITPYVADGASFVLIASNDEGNRRNSSRYSVIRATLSLSTRNNTWWAKAYRQGDNTWEVPLSLDVNVTAELRATIKKDGTTFVSKNVPSAQFSTNYSLKMEHPIAYGGSSGVYELHLELVATDETLSSLPAEVLDFNIFCVAADSTANLFLVNNKASSLENYTNNRVFDYAAYIGSGNHTLTLEAKENGTAIVTPSTVQAVNGTVGNFFLNMEMERMDDSDFTVNVKVHFDEEATYVFNENFTATNHLGYAATAGATLLVKASGRSNTEPNREQLVNLLNGNPINATWQNMTWSSVDGYLTKQMKDSENQNIDVSFIRLLSGETMEMPITPLSMRANEGRTLEILFQPRNVMNYDTPIITCLDADQGNDPDAFNGLRITSSRVTLQTASARNVDTQSKNFDPDGLIHLTIVINPAYNEAGNSFHACFIYMNGVKQRVFTYSRDLNVSANLKFGCADADLDIYAVRTYNAALTTDEVVTNAVNWKFSIADKALMKARNNIKENNKVDFNKVRSLCNVFVFKADDGSGSIPRLGMGKNDKIAGQLRTYWRDEPGWNSTVKCDLQGQGTTSMEYFRWNFKTSFSTAWAFDGGNHASIKKWCAKKNFASSMQSHKMGGTEAYDYLARQCGAVEANAARQAIWQYPFVGFSEDSQGRLTFIGLYTIGPDKGDKDTFGFSSNSVAMEGLDNDRLSTNFRVPWNDTTVVPDSSNEKYTVCGESSWEDSMKNAAGVEARWKPAYNFVYECAQLIKPWKGITFDGDTYAATLEGLLSYGEAIAGIDTSTPEGKAAYEEAMMYEYWISGNYDLYRYDKQTEQYVQSFTTAAINLSSQLCGKGYKVGEQSSGGQTTDILLTTILLANAADDDVRNTYFTAARLDKFKKEAGQYWDITNAFFHLAWVEFNAATDNLAKNTYPYLLDYTDPDGRWRWRQDDVDTVWPIDNQGKDKKPYCVELEDNYSSYGMASLSVWNGRYSQFWFTLKAAFATEYATFVRTSFFDAMHYGSATNVLQRILDFFQHFYFDRAQEYFGAALYNADGIYSYEQAYLYSGNYAHKSIALEQLLGDHYSAEKYWIRMRSIYMMSKYCADLFASGQTTDCFLARVSQGTNNYTITPAIYMYPVVQNGQQAIRGPRFWPGDDIQSWTTENITTAGDQAFRINGMSYLRNVGDLYLNTLKDAVTVAGNMLRSLNLGSHTAQQSVIRSTITAVTIDNATSLRELDLAQLSTLSGTVDLSLCANLRQLYAGGTGIAAVRLSDGGPLATLVLGNNITELQLLGKQMLTTLTLGSTARLTTVEMENCNSYTVSRVMAILSEVSVSQLVSVKLAFGTQNNPSVLTDNDIAELLTLNAADIDTKQFRGFVTKSSGSITGKTYAALENMNITYVGDVAPEVVIGSDDVVISDNACTIFSGEGATFKARVSPPTAGTARFSLYYRSGGNYVKVQEEANNKATYQNVTLDCVTGEVTTTQNETSNTVYIRAAVGDIYSDGYLEITVTKTVYMGGITITGTKSYVSAGDNTLLLTPQNAGYTVGPVSIQIALTQDGADAGSDTYLRVTQTNLARMELKAAVLGIPASTREYVLTVRVTDVKGTVYTDTATLTVQSIPITSFDLSGNSRLITAGNYAYNIDNILPANYNRGIASLSASVSSPTSGAASVSVNGTTGVTLAVSEMPSATETITLTVIATLVGGGNVQATKSVELRIVADYVDLGLPSGLKWATMNLGANAPEEAGLYFSWGNVEGHAAGSGYNFDSSTYNSTPGGGISGLNQHDSLGQAYDAAHAILGGSWRMPTDAEFKELYDNTDSELTTLNGVYGRKFMKKSDHSVFIFFPPAGLYEGTSNPGIGSYGYYWSRSWRSSSYGYILSFYGGLVHPQDALSRYYGSSVRAVQ